LQQKYKNLGWRRMRCWTPLRGGLPH
jgi:hypothetical protein